MSGSLRVGCVFLASGQSKRFQANKLTAKFHGMPLAEFVFNRFPVERFCQTVAVTRCALVSASAQRYGFQVVKNPDPASDIAQTIRLGLNAFDCSLDGCLFSVCDQPLVRVRSIYTLVDRFCSEPDAIVALGWKGNRGNPVLFPSSLFSALATLAPHQSGSSVIAQYSHLLRIVEAEGPQELLDIDTLADLKYLEQLCVSLRADS
ncbi:nucleotidyltransferase family protein [Anaerotruncus sp. X29]|nr:nucleotidyltransferase family protein [Anaerotruncus sp. X29]